MAIGNPSRGDLVLVHSQKLGLHGLFAVDSINGNNLVVAPVDHAGITAGGYKAQFSTVDKTTEVFAHHAATSNSA
jgi:hypothetical protein